VQRKHVGYRTTGVWFGEGVKSVREHAAIELFLNLWKPRRVKGVENALFDLGPIMHGQGRSSIEWSRKPLYARIDPRQST
jgi:hypothetical protein